MSYWTPRPSKRSHGQLTTTRGHTPQEKTAPEGAVQRSYMVE